MKNSVLTLTVLLTGLFITSALRADTIYTSQSAFNAAISVGSFSTNFTNFSGSISEPLNLSGNGYSTAITTGTGGLFCTSGHLFNNTGTNLIFSFTLGEDVTAVGGNFFDSDGGDNNFTVTLNDGTLDVVSSGTGFVGFTSLNPITSLTITASIPGANDITIGAVPEPASYVLLALGTLIVIVTYRHKRKESSALP
jgi:hypothetical protein